MVVAKAYKFPEICKIDVWINSFLAENPTFERFKYIDLSLPQNNIK